MRKLHGFELSDNEKMLGLAQVYHTDAEVVKKWVVYKIIENEVKQGRIPKSYLTRVNNRSIKFETAVKYLKRKGYSSHYLVKGNYYKICYTLRVV